MKKKLLMVFSGLSILTAVFFLVSGGYGLIGLMVEINNTKPETKNSLWNSFIPGPPNDRGAVDFSGFWGYRLFNSIYIWTVSGLKVFQVTPETTFFYTDTCSQKSVDERLLYGGKSSYSIKLSYNEWANKFRPGLAVKINTDIKSGNINSTTYDNADYYKFWSTKEIEEWCK